MSLKYKALEKQVQEKGSFKLVPIRFEDRMDIMRWRNEQIYHLRQQKPLSEEDQNRYFENVVSKLFDQDQPNQILFSFLENERCIGYGGLVHMNWVDAHAEISFIMDTELEKDRFQEIWVAYLELLESIAFDDLRFHKIFTYAYDLRPHLYPIFESRGFRKEAELVDHKLIDDKFVSIIIHAKLNYYE
jgi:RimJ/RimL family protein N-acetyltransferase